MKIKKSEFKKILQEEISKVLKERGFSDPTGSGVNLPPRWAPPTATRAGRAGLGSIARGAGRLAARAAVPLTVADLAASGIAYGFDQLAPLDPTGDVSLMSIDPATGAAEADSPSYLRPALGADAPGARGEGGVLVRDMSRAEREAYNARRRAGTAPPIVGVPTALARPEPAPEAEERPRRQSRSRREEPAEEPTVTAEPAATPTAPAPTRPATKPAGTSATTKSIAPQKSPDTPTKAPVTQPKTTSQPTVTRPRGETLRGPLAGFGSGGIFPGRMEEIPIREIIEQEINKILNGVSTK
mgnify:CR=1 FL=1